MKVNVIVVNAVIEFLVDTSTLSISDFTSELSEYFKLESTK